jgi:hypothetical protein
LMADGEKDSKNAKRSVSKAGLAVR